MSKLAIAFAVLAGTEALRAGDESPWPANRIAIQPREVDDDRILAAWKAQGWEGEACGPVAVTRETMSPPLRVESWEIVEGAWDEAEAIARHFASLGDNEAHALTWRTRPANALGGVDGEIAIARATLDSPAAEVRMARLAGASSLLVNGEPFQGDPERRNYEGVPVALRKGANELVVFGIRKGFDLEFWKPSTRMVIATWDAWIPRRAEGPSGPSLDETLVVGVINASTEPCAVLDFHYGRLGGFAADAMPPPHEFTGLSPGPAPLCSGPVMALVYDLGLKQDELARQSSAAVSLVAFDDADAQADRRVLRFATNPQPVTTRPARPLAWTEMNRIVGAPLPARPATVEMRVSVALIVGTRGDDATTRRNLALARFLHWRTLYECDIYLHVLADSDALPWILGTKSCPYRAVILVGERESNRAWVRLPADATESTVEPDAVHVVANVRPKEPWITPLPACATIRVANDAAARAAMVMPWTHADPFSAPAAAWRATASGLERVR